MKAPAAAMRKDGKPMRVLRPDNPSIPLELARLATEGKFDFGAIPDEAQARGVQYTFAGWLSADGTCVLDHDGSLLGWPHAGDSFCGFKEDE
jgi:hypothetical protein